MAVGFACLLRRGTYRQQLASARSAWLLLLLAVVVANAPDIDYAPGILVGDLNRFHHYYTHTIGWVAVTSLGVWLVLCLAGRRAGLGMLVLLTAAMLSHLAADVFTQDGRAPYGIMLLWPFSDTRVISPVSAFASMSKGSLSDLFTARNLVPALIELAWGLGLIGVVLLYKRLIPPSRSSIDHA